MSVGDTGGFVVTVRNDQSVPVHPNVREITSVGWTPTNDPTVATTKGHRQVFARVLVLPRDYSQAPCALCVNGDLSVGGSATVNGTNTDPTCGGNTKYGASRPAR